MLFELYVKSAGTKHIGEPTFIKLLKLLTIAGKAKSGLSRFYIDALHLQKVVHDFIEEARVKLPIIIHASSSSDAAITMTQATLESLKVDWTEAIEFFKNTYAHVHVRQVGDCDGFLTHCSEFALGGACAGHVHEKQCDLCIKYFNVLTRISESCKGILGGDFPEAMLTAESLLRRYIAHTVRGRHQALALRAIVDSLKQDPSHLLLVIDHKQKVQSSDNREAQEA
jgi:hypothetical protein